MRLADLVQQAAARLCRAGLPADEAALDAEVLARHVLGWDRARYFAYRDEPPPPGFAERYRALVARRSRREPTAYLVGRREFWGLEFEVTPDVLIPRPETELIVEEALVVARQMGREPRSIVDAGTGSGCLAVTLARLFPHARVTATDTSPSALAVARLNAARHGVADRIHFVEGPFVPQSIESADLIVSNPPYVSAKDLASLPPEVRDWEPRAALIGGDAGIEAIDALVAQASTCLVDGGWLVFEFGADQAAAVQELVASKGFEIERLAHDLQGLPRVAIARRARDGRARSDRTESHGPALSDSATRG